VTVEGTEHIHVIFASAKDPRIVFPEVLRKRCGRTFGLGWRDIEVVRSY
jgi:hypothetical protein